MCTFVTPLVSILLLPYDGVLKGVVVGEVAKGRGRGYANRERRLREVLSRVLVAKEVSTVAHGGRNDKGNNEGDDEGNATEMGNDMSDGREGNLFERTKTWTWEQGGERCEMCEGLGA